MPSGNVTAGGIYTPGVPLSGFPSDSAPSTSLPGTETFHSIHHGSIPHSSVPLGSVPPGSVPYANVSAAPHSRLQPSSSQILDLSLPSADGEWRGRLEELKSHYQKLMNDLDQVFDDTNVYKTGVAS